MPPKSFSAPANVSSSIAFVRDRTQFAQNALQAASAVLAAHGRNAMLLETFAGAEKDFGGIAQRLKAARITHIALAAFPSEAALLLGEVRRVNPDVVVLATDQLADPVFGRLAGAAADGIRVALAPDARAYPTAAATVARLNEAGLEASRTALATYAAMQVLLATVTAIEHPDPAQVVQALAANTFHSILGPLRFDAQGAASLPPHVFYTWRSGQLLPP